MMMAIPDELMSTIGPVVESVASDLSRRYHRYGGEQADLAQAGWLWCFEHPHKIVDWFDDEKYDPASATKLLARTLRNDVQRYGEQLKAQALGYSVDDLVWYTRAQVRDLLPYVFDEESRLNPPASDADTERRSPSVPAEGGNWIATLADISQAYDRLEKSDRDLLAGFHRDGLSNQMLSEVYGVTKQSMSNRHDRAVGRLVKLLGGPKPRWEHDEECGHWTGGRHAMTNAHAQAIQSNNYEE